MKAAVLEEINAPLGIRNVELTELKVGQVLVKIFSILKHTGHICAI